MSEPKDVKQQARRVVKALRQDYADAVCALVHENPLQLLVATILSAQCTDERVNQVTPELFRRCPTAKDLAEIERAELEALIQTTGFFRNKAKNIQAAAQALCDRHGGETPRTLEELVQLPGVGRKTANVVLGTAFGIASGVVVDTHVGRLARRLGLTKHQDAVKAEADLMQVVPRKEWVNFSHRLIHHGRRVCKARRPLCEDCSMRAFCPRVGVAEAA